MASELYSYYKSEDKKPLGSLPASDLEVATAAILKVLKSEAAVSSLPSLIEGPDYSVDGRGWSISLEPPPPTGKDTQARYSKAVEKLVLADLPVDLKILKEFESAPAATAYKEHRLLEIVCAAVHHLAIDLYTTAFPPPSVASSLEHFIPPPYPVIAHSQYYASKPWKGVLDLKAVGFWAEAQIFGGVAHFDRRAYGTDDSEYTGVWLHGLPNSYTDCLWRVPDNVVTEGLKEASLPFSIADALKRAPHQHGEKEAEGKDKAEAAPESSARENEALLGIQEAQEDHQIYRDPFLANHEAYTGDHEDEVLGLSDEDLAEIQELRAKKETEGVSEGLKKVTIEEVRDEAAA